MAQETNYQLDVVNNSVDFADFCVYQTDPDLGVRNVQSLAWFVKPMFPTTTGHFTWSIDYSFVWSYTGLLVPGVKFETAQAWPADLTTDNQVMFGYADGAYTFANGTVVSTAETGTLYIGEEPSVPLNQASVGIGMSGAGTFAVQAQPNLQLSFTPHPTYWITAGTFDQGDVLDVGSITQPAKIDFPPGVFKMTATLNRDNTWTLAPTS